MGNDCLILDCRSCIFRLLVWLPSNFEFFEKHPWNSAKQSVFYNFAKKKGMVIFHFTWATPLSLIESFSNKLEKELFTPNYVDVQKREQL